MTDHELIYGLGKIERIVSIEIKDDVAEIFYLDENKQIQSTFEQNKFWILSSKPTWGDKSIKLEGNLHYKYAMTYKTRESFMGDRMKLKKWNDIYSIFESKEAYMVRYGETYMKGLKPTDISNLSFDIETTGLDENAEDAMLIIIANTYRDRMGNIMRVMFSYEQYNTQGDMILAWCKWVREIDPDVISGYNVNSYDWNYIRAIADRENVQLELGRDGSPMTFDTYVSKKRIDQTRDVEYKRPRVYGRELIDVMFLAINYDTIFKKYESLGLKSIIATEGLEKEGRVFYDAGQIRKNYKNPVELEKIKKYAEFDGDDSLALFDLYISNYFYTAQMCPKSFQAITESASGSQINSILVRAYLSVKHSIPKPDESEHFEGGLSIGIPGIYKNCIKIDLLSAYPSTIIQYEIYDKEKDPKKYLLTLTKTLFERRKFHKVKHKETGERYHDDMSNSLKVLINSIFGFMGSAGLNFNSPKNAAKVTEYCRGYLEKAVQWATNKSINEWKPKESEIEDDTIDT